MRPSEEANQLVEYQVLIAPAQEGGFVVTVPALPGCVTQGETFDEAVEMARDCIEGFLTCLAESGEPIPAEPTPSGCTAVRMEVARPAATASAPAS